MNGDRALADRNEGRQSTIENGERFIDSRSGLPAFRYPNFRGCLDFNFYNYKMLLLDRYVQHIPRWEQLETINV